MNIAPCQGTLGVRASAHPRVGFHLLQREALGRVELQQAGNKVPRAFRRLLELGESTRSSGLLRGKGDLARQHCVKNHAKAPTIDRLVEFALRDFREL
mmetsp:Transcript_87447/g.168350  ORF Transcript_87447/g.168350 Transcript_87447/m.168350 type:complete len:98 (-) Transcript_87447:1213-1506(-)